MTRATRLFDILQLLRDGRLHRAGDIAAATGVSLRTVYRDMDRLAAEGLPVSGTPGAGYRLAALTSLPPLTLTDAELAALNLALAVVGASPDADLRAAAQSLTDKIDAALPAEAPPEAWPLGAAPFGNAARGFAQIPTLRAAIQARQKLRLTVTTPQGAVRMHRVRPLRLEHWARLWCLIAWSEDTARQETFRLDLIDTAEALPELFADEQGKTL